MNESIGNQRIPFFGKGRSPLLSKNHDASIRALNALLRMRIVRKPDSSEDQVFISDAGVTLQIGEKGFGDRSSATDISVKRGQITTINNDYLVVDQWDDDAEDFGGGSVNVAKPPHLRSTVTSRTIWGVSITYGTYTTNAQQRTATYNAVSVIQRVHNPYIVGDEIWFAATGELVGVSDYTRIDLNIAARDWYTETEGCNADGDPQYAFVARGPWSDTAIGEDFA